ncbi:MAG: HAD-IIA family hydrolase [Campylobacterales bacterium]|nr:HAD-IIA family hydrolase [Campylobacterales bacterium]
MIFLDVQGTLINDTDRLPLPGALEFVAHLNRRAIPYVVVTNNSMIESRAFLGYLQGLGFGIDEAHYVDPLMILDGLLPRGSRLAAFGYPEFLELLKQMGYRLDTRSPDAVLLSVKPDYTFEECAKIIELLFQGAALYGMHETSTYALGPKRYPGVGALLRMFAYATGVGYQVVGKPGDAFFDAALERLRQEVPDAAFKSVRMISDDALGDLFGAKKRGMQTHLVLTGKVRSHSEVALLEEAMRPDEVHLNLNAIMEQL